MTEQNNLNIIPTLSSKGIISPTNEQWFDNYPHKEKHPLQFFYDDPKMKGKYLPKRNDRTRKPHHYSQSNGLGVFRAVNAMIGDERKLDMIEMISAWVCESDELTKKEQKELIAKSPLQPSTVVESKKSLHLYRFAKDANIESWIKICVCLAGYFNGDIKIAKNPAVCLRLPGHQHLKNPKDPYDVKAIYIDPEKTYTEQEMIDAFGEYFDKEQMPKSKNSAKKKRKKNIWNEIRKRDTKEMLLSASGTELVNNETIGFSNNGNNTSQIVSSGQATSSWIDEHGLIGSHDNGGPYWYNYLLRYPNIDESKILKWVAVNFKDKIKSKFTEYDVTLPKAGEITADMCVKVNDKGIIVKIKHNQCALFFLQNHTIGVTNESYTYFFDKDIWRPIKSAELGNMIKKFLVKNIDYSNWSTFDIEEVVKLIKIESYSKNLTKALNDMPDFDLCLSDTIIDLATQKKRKYSPEEYKFNKLSFGFDLINGNNQMPPTELLKFLKDVTHHYKDQEGVIQVLRRFFGSCLVPRVGKNKSILLLGNTAQGKTTFFEIMIDIIGSKNTSYKKILQLIDDRFAREGLIGNLVNIDGDLDEGSNLDSGIIKWLLEGQMISVERKYKDPYDARPKIKFLLASNTYNGLGLNKSTVKRRILSVVFNRETVGIQEDLLAKIIIEREQIFSWAYGGLLDLIHNGKGLYHPELTISNSTTKHDIFSGLEECIENIVSIIEHDGEISYKKIKDIVFKYPNVTNDRLQKRLLQNKNIIEKRKNTGNFYIKVD